MSAKSAPKNRIENPTAFSGDAPEIIPASSDYSGTYYKIPDPKQPRAGDSCNYSLCVVPEDPRGNTHRLRCEPEYALEDGEQVMTHPGFIWEGNVAEFKAQFEKV